MAAVAKEPVRWSVHVAYALGALLVVVPALLYTPYENAKAQCTRERSRFAPIASLPGCRNKEERAIMALGGTSCDHAEEWRDRDCRLRALGGAARGLAPRR